MNWRLSLALVADAWSRTYRSRTVTFSRTEGAQQTHNGIMGPAKGRGSEIPVDSMQVIDEQALSAHKAHTGIRY